MKKKLLYASVASVFLCRDSSAKPDGSYDVIELSESLRTLTGEMEELKRQNEEVSKRVASLEDYIKKKDEEDATRKEDEMISKKTPEEIIKIAEDSMGENSMEAARRMLNRFVEKKPESVYCGLMLFHVGNSYFMEKNYKMAAIEYMKSFKKNSKGSKSAEALYKLALCFKQLSRLKECKATLEKLVEDYSHDANLIKKARSELSNLK